MRGNIDISVMWNIQGKTLNFSATIQTARNMGHNWQHLVGVWRFAKDFQGRWRGSYFQKKSTAVIEYNGHGGAPNNEQWGWNKIWQHCEPMSVKTDSGEMFMIFGGKLLQNERLSFFYACIILPPKALQAQASRLYWNTRMGGIVLWMGISRWHRVSHATSDLPLDMW
jgi:hypothetical protein